METRAAKRRRLQYGNRWSLLEPEPPVASTRTRTRRSMAVGAAQRAAHKTGVAGASGDDDDDDDNDDDTQAPRFTLFGRLPAELRLEIWRLIEEQARQPLHPLRVRLYRGYERVPEEQGDTAKPKPKPKPRPKRKRPAYTTRLVPRLTAMPDLGPATRARRALLRVCREARCEYLRRWSATLDLDRGGLVRFDAGRDLVYLDIANRALMDDLALLRATNPAALPPFARAIRHLGLEMTPHLPQWLLMARDHMLPRLDFLLSFPALRSLSLVNFGCFAGEVTWGRTDEARLLLARSAGHRVYFRSFAVLPSFDYSDRRRGAAPRVGRQTSLGAHTRHDCAICSIHRCVYVREMLRNVRPTDTTTTTAGAATTTEAERRWLGNLKFHTLLAAATPEVARHVLQLDPASLEAGSDKVPPADKSGSGDAASTGAGYVAVVNAAGLDYSAFYEDSDDDDAEEDDDMFWEDDDADQGFDDLVAIMGPYGEQFF